MARKININARVEPVEKFRQMKFIAFGMVTAFLLIAMLAQQAYAEVLSGRVIAVADGDTLTLLDENNQAHKIRLAAIDAPEKNQPFGTRAKQALSRLCYNKGAEAKVATRDQYDRIVAVVYCESVNANETMLTEGMAWVYTQYARKFPHFRQLEDRAREKRMGLWIDNDPVPPWEFRRNR